MVLAYGRGDRHVTRLTRSNTTECNEGDASLRIKAKRPMSTDTKAAAPRTFVTFEAALHDPMAEMESDLGGPPPGRTLISALRERMTARGFLRTEPKQHEFYGWMFVTGTPMLVLQHPGPWLVLATRKPSLWQRLWGHLDDSVDRALLEALNDSLLDGVASTPPRWHTRAEYFAGAPDSVAEHRR